MFLDSCPKNEFTLVLRTIFRERGIGNRIHISIHTILLMVMAAFSSFGYRSQTGSYR